MPLLRDRLPVVVAASLAAAFALVPIGYLLWEAFAASGSPLAAFRTAVEGVGIGTMVVNTLVFSAGASLVAIASGTILAFLVVRTDLPCRRLVFAVALLPLVVPGVLYSIAWIFLASPRIGALREVAPFDVFGLGGMILVEGLHLAPLVVLLMAAAFRAVDPALEDAARMSGASRRTVLRRVTLPLVRPALLACALVMIVRSIEAFEVPALLGIPSGTYVFTSRIWEALDRFPANIQQAAALSLPLLAVTAIGVLALSRLERRRGARATITGRRGAGPVPLIALGRWRVPLALATWAHLALASLAPLAMLAWASLQPYYSEPSVDGLARVTGANYTALVERSANVEAFVNSLLVSGGAATAVMTAMALVAWLVVKGTAPGRWALDGLVSLPLAIPGTVLGAALLVVSLRSPIPVYGTLWILLIAYFTRFMPYGLRYAAAVVAQLGDELDDAARMSGARFAQTFRRVLLPLLFPGLLAGWLYVLVVSMRELSTSILLAAPGTEVLPVRLYVLFEGGQLPELAALGMVTTLLLGGLVLLAWRVGARIGVRVA